MGKITKLNEDALRGLIMAEIKKAAAVMGLNEIRIKTTDELADGSYERMCGILKGKIESLFVWKDSCRTLEELQELIDRTFGDIIE